METNRLEEPTFGIVEQNFNINPQRTDFTELNGINYQVWGHEYSSFEEAIKKPLARGRMIALLQKEVRFDKTQDKQIHFHIKTLFTETSE